MLTRGEKSGGNTTRLGVTKDSLQMKKKKCDQVKTTVKLLLVSNNTDYHFMLNNQ